MVDRDPASPCLRPHGFAQRAGSEAVDHAQQIATSGTGAVERFGHAVHGLVDTLTAQVALQAASGEGLVRVATPLLDLELLRLDAPLRLPGVALALPWLEGLSAASAAVTESLRRAAAAP